MTRNFLNAVARVVGFDPTTIVNDSKLEQKLLYLLKNATAFSGTLGTQTLTTSGVFSDTETVTIGDVTYTMVAALTEAKATGTLTSTDVFTNGETVTIDGITYTFRTALSDPEVEYEVLIGASAAASLDNLKSAINGTGTAGTDYSSITPAHPTCTATTNANDSQVVEFNSIGTAGNRVVTVSTAADNTWGAATLTGGLEPVANEVLIGASAAASLDNLKTTINGTGQGTTCSTTTAAHPQVTADANNDTTQVVTAREFSVNNASIATTETAANASWGAATLASGVADVNAVVASGTRDTNAGIAGDKNVL